jgi:hypothetical protein
MIDQIKYKEENERDLIEDGHSLDFQVATLLFDQILLHKGNKLWDYSALTQILKSVGYVPKMITHKNPDYPEYFKRKQENAVDYLTIQEIRLTLFDRAKESYRRRGTHLFSVTPDSENQADELMKACFKLYDIYTQDDHRNWASWDPRESSDCEPMRQKIRGLKETLRGYLLRERFSLKDLDYAVVREAVTGEQRK